MPAAPDVSFRTPIPPAPVERIDLPHPAVPPPLDGLTILHISDLHVRRNLLAGDRYRAILHALDTTPADLIVLTGDIMDEPGHERPALDTLEALAARWRPRLGVFAIFGNHDTPDFQRAARARFPNISFIGGRTHDIPFPSATLRLIGLDWPEDVLGVMLGKGSRDQGTRGSRDHASIPQSLDPSIPSLPFALAHHPTSLISAAEMGIPILLAGHTHAGQIRLHPRLAPHTSSDLPPHQAAGMLRLGDTVCCITRGLGDGVIENLRINCPRQMPLYTLRRGPVPGRAPGAGVSQVRAW